MFATSNGIFFAENNYLSSQGGIDSFTKLMLHLDNNLTDSEITPKIVSDSGGVTFSNVIAKFGYSGLFTAASSQYLSTPDSADWFFGTGDFTIDLWIYPNSLPGAAAFTYVISQYGTITADRAWIIDINNNVLEFNYNSGGAVIQGGASSAALTTGQWYHVAVVRSGNNFTLYLNGTATGAATVDANTLVDSTTELEIGQGNGVVAGRYFDGYMDEIRISKGVARWTSNFTPPTAPYTT